MGKQQTGTYGYSGSYIRGYSSSRSRHRIGMLDSLDGQKTLRKNFVSVYVLCG